MHAVALDWRDCTEYMPTTQAVHEVAREQPAALCWPAGQSAQALHMAEMQPGQIDRSVSYCPAPQPVFP